MRDIQLATGTVFVDGRGERRLVIDDGWRAAQHIQVAEGAAIGERTVHLLDRSRNLHDARTVRECVFFYLGDTGRDIGKVTLDELPVRYLIAGESHQCL